MPQACGTTSREAKSLKQLMGCHLPYTLAAVLPRLYLKTCSHCKVKGRHLFRESSSRGMCQMVWTYVECQNCGHKTDVNSLKPLVVDLDG